MSVIRIRLTTWAQRWVRRVVVLVVLASVVSAAVGEGAATAKPGGKKVKARARTMTVVGHTDLGGDGLNGQVAVVRSTAVVATGYVPLSRLSVAHLKTAALNTSPPCVTVPVKVVDLSRPKRPTVAATIPVPAGQAASDVDALSVSTPAFSGDLVAISFATCQLDLDAFRARGVVQPGSFADRGVAYYDVSDPYEPRLVGRYLADADAVAPTAPPCGPPRSAATPAAPRTSSPSS